MTEVLGLFCGGPALYRGDVPKPLQPIAGRSLLEQFLRHGRYRSPERIYVMCDESHERSFAAISDALDGRPIEIVTAPDGSTTLARLQRLLQVEDVAQASLVHTSYPDVFFDGDLAVPDSVVAGDEVAVSVTPLRSRFPRLITDPYSGRVRSISNHTSPVPANPLHVFGGHLLARPGVLSSLLATFAEETSIAEPSLEYDFFGWLINRGVVEAITLYGDWHQIDSARDIARLEADLLNRMSTAQEGWDA